MSLRNPPKLARSALKSYALKLLAGRALSTAQLKDRLRRRAADAADVEPVTGELREHGFLNDPRFAEGFATSRRDSRGFGQQRVLSDLVRQKVASGVAQQAVDEAFAGVDEPAMIAGYLARKYRGQDLASLLKNANKLASIYRRLRGAGFSASNSIRALKHYSSAADQLESMEEPDAGVEPA